GAGGARGADAARARSRRGAASQTSLAARLAERASPRPQRYVALIIAARLAQPSPIRTPGRTPYTRCESQTHALGIELHCWRRGRASATSRWAGTENTAEPRARGVA